MSLLTSISSTPFIAFPLTIQEIVSYGIGLLGAIGLLYNYFNTRRTGKEDVDVKRDAVEVNEKDASTRGASMALEALTEGLRELRTELGEQKVKSTAQDVVIASQAATIAVLEENRVASDTRMATQDAKIEYLERLVPEMVAHIELLEKLIPDPPGIPSRPIWDHNK